MEQHVTIKALRKNLRSWGKFWRNKESIQGFSSRSISEHSDQSFSSRDLSDNMYVPQQIEKLTESITKLRPECIRAIRAKYICELEMPVAAIRLGFDSKRSAEFWLVRAERELLTLI